MNPELKQAWIEALESGTYQKGKLALRRASPSGDTWCCLGVLGDVINPHAWKLANHIDVPYDVRDSYIYAGDNTAYIPFDYLDVDTQGLLSCINDRSETFEPVIAYIKEYL